MLISTLYNCIRLKTTYLSSTKGWQIIYWSTLTYWNNGVVSFFFTRIPNCHMITDQGTWQYKERETFLFLVLSWGNNQDQIYMRSCKLWCISWETGMPGSLGTAWVLAPSRRCLGYFHMKIAGRLLQILLGPLPCTYSSLHRVLSLHLSLCIVLPAYSFAFSANSRGQELLFILVTQE